MCVFVYTHVVEKVDESMTWVFWLCGNVLSKLSVVSTESTHWPINKAASAFHVNPLYGEKSFVICQEKCKETNLSSFTLNKQTATIVGTTFIQ